MKTKPIKIKTYKGIDIFYNEHNGYLYFNYEDNDREVKYLFEVEKIIDEPRWEDCNLEGYFIDGVFSDFIGLAKANKKDTKSGKPYWLLKGEYNSDYKVQDSWKEIKVYPKNFENDKTYSRWLIQRQKVNEEKNKLKQEISNLK